MRRWKHNQASAENSISIMFSQLADFGVRNVLAVGEFHGFIGQQSQTTLNIALWRRTVNQGCNLGSLFSINCNRSPGTALILQNL